MARWDVKLGGKVVARIEAPDRWKAQVIAYQQYGESAKVESVAEVDASKRRKGAA